MLVSISGFISEEIFYLQQIILSKVKLSGIRSALSRAILRTPTLKVYSLHDRISTLFTKITNLPSILIQTEIIIHNIGITMLKDFLCSQSDQHVDLEKVTDVPVWNTVFLLLWLLSLQFLSLDFSLITFFQSSLLFLSVASRTWNCIIFYAYWFYPYSGWAFSGLLTDEGGKKGCPFLRSVTHILQWSNLAQLYLT